MEQEIATILLKVKAVTLRTYPPYRWVSGILAPIYTDNRILMSYTRERKKIVNAFVKKIRDDDINPEVIAGIATSGIPFAAWIAQEMNLPMVYIKKKPKDYGKENLIEGKLNRNKRVLVVEDLISTGGSSLNGITAVRDAGAKADHIIAIFTYGLSIAEANLAKANVQLHTLTNFNTLVNVAVKENYLSESEVSTVLEWAMDPGNWK
ncbi:MAG: orotate phosphoribosyltransferase [archaeon]